jgi:hypothetical protein
LLLQSVTTKFQNPEKTLDANKKAPRIEFPKQTKVQPEFLSDYVNPVFLPWLEL